MELTITTILGVAALLCGCATAAQGGEQASGRPASRPSMTPDADLGLDVAIEHRAILASSFDNAPGDLAIGRTALSISRGWQLGERDELTPSLGYEFRSFRFGSGTNIAGSSAPFSETHSIGFGGRWSHQFDDAGHWNSLVELVGSMEAERTADWTDGLQLFAQAGASYRLQDGLDVGLVGFFYTKLEDSPAAIAIPFVEWQITDDVSLRTREGIELSWNASPELVVAVRADFERHQFRLSDRGPVPGGAGEIERIPIGVKLGWSASERVYLQVYAGTALKQRLKVDNASGNSVARLESDGLPVELGFYGQVRF